MYVCIHTDWFFVVLLFTDNDKKKRKTTLRRQCVSKRRFSKLNKNSRNWSVARKQRVIIFIRSNHKGGSVEQLITQNAPCKDSFEQPGAFGTLCAETCPWAFRLVAVSCPQQARLQLTSQEMVQCTCRHRTFPQWQQRLVCGGNVQLLARWPQECPCGKEKLFKSQN